MAKYAVEQIVTKYWRVQENAYRIHPNNTVTIKCIAYASKEDALENSNGKSIDHDSITIPLHGNEKIQEQHYIQQYAENLGGTAITL